jgi:hypothetical protein
MAGLARVLEKSLCDYRLIADDEGLGKLALPDKGFSELNVHYIPF